MFDFGSRRLPGPQAALLSARAASIGGCAGTSYALAGEVYGIPVMGTLSQGFLAAYPSDSAAIDAFALHFPKVGYISLPGDSFEAGVAQLAEHRDAVRIVRVDHWDLDMASRKVRKALNAHGMESVSILGSGALQESAVSELTRKEAPVDLYAIGRELALGDRHSEFTLNYRIAEMWRGAELELVTRRGASMYPGMKQLLRGPKGDLLCLEDELDLLDLQGYRPLLVPLLREGEFARPEDSIEGVRDRLQRELSVLPEEVKNLDNPGHWPVQPSDRLARAALS